MKLKNQINQNLIDQEIVYLYYRNKQDLEEYIKFISSDDDHSLDMIKDQHYKTCKSVNKKLEYIVRSIWRRDPELVNKIKLILNPK